MAVFKNKTRTIKAILARVKEELSPQEMTQWVNQKTTVDKFTAIHFASFRGNIDICKLLVSNSANINAKNAYGLNVMHIAA